MNAKTLIIIWTCWASWATAFAAAERPKTSIEKQIDDIVSQAGDLSEADDSLWQSQALKALVSHPEKHRAEILAYLRKNPALPDEKVYVAVLTVQCLSDRDYVSFVNEVSGLPKGKTGERALFYSVIPGEEWSVRMQINYDQPGAKAALANADKSPNATKKLRGIIKNIQSGEYAKLHKASKEAPVLRCDDIEKSFR